MGQRLIHPGLRAIVHPIGFNVHGNPIWPVMGGDGTDGGGDDSGGDGGDDAGEDDSDDADEEDADEDESDKKAGKSKKKDEDDEDGEPVPGWKHKKLHARMTAADRRASDLQKELDAIKGGKDVAEEVRKEIETLKPEIEKLRAENTTLKIRVAFFGANTYDWHDAEAALASLDLSDIEVDDKGRVDKRELRAALKVLAKEKPWMLRPAKDDEGKGSGEAPPAAGSKMAGRRKGQKGAPDTAALKSRFPVLNR